MTSTHGSHASSGTGSHSNSSTVTSSPSVASHSVSWGSTLRSSAYTSESISSPNNLALFTAAINDIRSSMGASRISTLTSESALQTAISNLSSLSVRRYQWGTISISGHGSTNGGHGSHANSSVSNNSGSLIGHANATTISNNKTNTKSKPSTYDTYYTASVGSITYSSDPATLLSRLNSKVLLCSYMPSFGTYSRSITNHSSHSSSHSDSKKELKENIEELKLNATDLIKRINLVSFNYKKDTEYDPSITHYGFIADDTDEKFATQYHDRMDYMNCIGLLLKSVQELSQKIENLEKKIDS